MYPSDLVVVREVPWREENDLVVILAPRYSKHTLFGRLLRRLFGDSTVRLKMDALGSHAWKLFDGSTTVAEMTASLEEAFGEEAVKAEARLGLFLKELQRNDWVRCMQRVEEGEGEEQGKSGL